METLVINGSARNDNNTEKAISRHCPFDKYVSIELRKLDIKHYQYSQQPEDDFIKIAEQLTTSKNIVFATPVYWYAMSGLMKVFLTG